VPLVLLQHFRGNLENWDPQLVAALASQRRVVAFDNAGVGGTTGTTPDTIEQMARDAIAFIAALDAPLVDILGFSIGSFVAARSAAATRPPVEGCLMDPTVTLRDLRAAIAAGDVEAIDELFAALDRWLARGGFLPADWSRE
jgi:pimeloyl-ACP methyl ester carboxylesterase